jgi:hypothetical protein
MAGLAILEFGLDLVSLARHRQCDRESRSEDCHLQLRLQAGLLQAEKLHHLAFAVTPDPVIPAEDSAGC